MRHVGDSAVNLVLEITIAKAAAGSCTSGGERIMHRLRGIVVVVLTRLLGRYVVHWE